MKITVFQSDKGDCLLVTGDDTRHLLVDGGMSSSYTEHVVPTLSEVRELGQRLDLVYVSHIDEDHISGILKMMDDLVAWRVHDFQLSIGNTHHKAPRSKCPPEAAAIWHNAFHEQVGENSGPIADMLAATATILSGASSEDIRGLAASHRDLATSIPQAIKLSRRIGTGQLNIPLNREFNGKLMFVRGTQPQIQLGGMSIFIIGPFERDLKELRKKWNAWLRENREALDTIARKARADEERLPKNEVERIIRPLLAQAEELGQRENVTTPNLASLMLLVEESGKTVLLTGDGHADDIIKGLKHHNRLDGSGRLHVNVLKIQHHGSEHNIHEDFCQTVTADNYVFCGNGEHENPDLRVVELIVTSRLNDGDVRNFKLWFNSHSSVTKKEKAKGHMRELESLVNDLAGDSDDRMSFTFLEDHKFELTI